MGEATLLLTAALSRAFEGERVPLRSIYAFISLSWS
jgi:hypothetical protein